MLLRSQPLAPKVSKKLKLDHDDEIDDMSKKNIKSQRIDIMFSGILDGVGKRKIGPAKRLRFRWKRFKESFYGFKHAVRNHMKWYKTMKVLRPWDGYGGLIDVMMTHLKDYVAAEEQYGHATEECKNKKIASARETIELLERMKEPEEYSSRRRKDVKIRYPGYKYLVTEYENGSISYSGDFVEQGSGWTGIEGGADPREGYFEFMDGRLELASSPNPTETDRLLTEIRQYNDEIRASYDKAEYDSDKDFEKLCQLLKDNLYSWWD